MLFISPPFGNYLNFPKTQNWFCKKGAKDKKYISLNHTVKNHRFLLIDFFC